MQELITQGNYSVVVIGSSGSMFLSQEEKTALELHPHVGRKAEPSAMNVAVIEYGKRLCGFRYASDVQGAVQVQEKIDNLPADTTHEAREYLARCKVAYMAHWPVGGTVPSIVLAKGLQAATSTIQWSKDGYPNMGLSRVEAVS